MSDFATLVLGAKATGLLKGKEALKETREEAGRTQDAVDNLGNKFTKTGDKAERAGKDVDGFSSSTSRARQLALGATKALAGMAIGFASIQTAGASVGMARDFNAAMAETSTLIEGTPAQMQAITSATKDLVASYGGDRTTKVQAFYQAISAGADGVAGATEVLDTANRLAIGGVTTITEGVDSLTTAMNAYGPEVLSAAQASDAMFVAMKAGKTTIGELGSNLGSIVPIASSVGVSFDEVVGGIAALTTQGLSTASATTGLRQVLASVIAPTKQATDAAKALGIEFDVQALKSKGLVGFLDQVIEKTGGNEEAMAQLFGSVEALGAVLAFSGGAGQKFAGIMSDMSEKAGATDAAYNKIADSLNDRFNVLTSAAADKMLELGNVLLSILVPALEASVTGFTLVSENIDILAVALAGMAATQIPAVIAALATFATGMSISSAAAGAFTIAVNIARGALVALGGPLGIVWGILGAGAAAWAVWGKGANEGETAAYDAAEGTSSLLIQLDEFYQTSAPAAAAKAIDMANANHKLAASAFEAAKAELAKRRALLDMRESSGVNGTTGSIRTTGITETTTTVSAAAREMDAAKAALDQAINDRKVAATVVTGTMSEIMSATVESGKVLKDHTVTLDVNSDAFKNNATSAGKSSGASKAALKDAKQLADEIQALEYYADPLRKYNGELAELNQLLDAGLSPKAYNKALNDLNEELISSVPLVGDLSNAFDNWMDSGFKNFKSFTNSLLDMFTNMLKSMLSSIVRNKIIIPITTALTGGGSALSAATGAQGGGGGILGSLTGLGGGSGAAAGSGIFGSITSGIGSIVSGVGAGFNMALGGLASGGLSGMTGVIGTQLGAATASLGAFGAAIGAIALPLAAVGAVFSFFKKKTKELDAGLRLTVDGLDTMVESFRKIETKRFWGLSKKVRTSYDQLGDEAAQPLINTISALANSVIGLGDVFGFEASNIDHAKLQVKISTKGLSDEEIEEAIAEEMARIGDVFADSIVGTFDEVVTTMVEYQNPLMKLLGKSGPLREVSTTVERVNEEFEALKKEGEGSYDALSRLVSSIQTVNVVLDTFNMEMLDVTLAGADMASSLADMFGGLEELTTATNDYYSTMYTEQEQLDRITANLTETFAELGNQLPATRGEYRALVEAQDLSTEAGRRMFTALVSMSGQLDAVLPALDSLTNKLGALVGIAVNEALGTIDDQIAAADSMASTARQSATEFYRLADSLRASAGSIGSITTAAELSSAGASYATTLAKALSGDTAALNSLGSQGQSLASDSAGFAQTATELKRVEIGIRNQLNEAAAVSEALGLGADYQAMLYEVESAALSELKEMLESGEVTQALLNEQIAVLGRIKDQIASSGNLQITTAVNAAGETVDALMDNSGNIVGALSEEGAKYIGSMASYTNSVIAGIDRNSSMLETSFFNAMDANSDGIINAYELESAKTLSSNQSSFDMLADIVSLNGNRTVAQISASLSGKASDSAIASLVSAVDKNKDGIITADEHNSSRMIAEISSSTLDQLQALSSQTGGLSSSIASASLGLSNQLVAAIDSNSDGIISVEEANRAAILASNSSLSSALKSAIESSGSMTASQIRASMAGKASDASISAVINAVDRNKDGIISAEETAAARTLTGLSESTSKYLQGLISQSGTFTNAITGQTTQVTGAQGLTNDELSKVQNLQGETVSITELVEQAVNGNQMLTEALLNRMTGGITVSGISGMVAGLDEVSNLITRIVDAQEAQLAAAEAEANRQVALAKAQASLEMTAAAQATAVSEVEASSQAIYALARQYGIYLNAKSGPLDYSQSAQFGVNDQGLFEAQYNQITNPGGKDVRGFKNKFYSDGGVYDQTYGRAAELKALAQELEARRQEIIDLGGVPAFATGGDHDGGYRWVGENGPELEATGSSRIFNAQQSKDIMSTAGDASRAEAAETRRVLVEATKHMKRTADIMRKWDIDGYPAEREVDA